MLRRFMYVRICAMDKLFAHVMITEQGQRGLDFSHNAHGGRTNRFHVDDLTGVLWSSAHPNYDADDHTLFVRGSRASQDNDIIMIPRKHLRDILCLILEYNRKYSKNTLVLDDVVEGMVTWNSIA